LPGGNKGIKGGRREGLSLVIDDDDDEEEGGMMILFCG